jgi:hypothetical protein
LRTSLWLLVRIKDSWNTGEQVGTILVPDSTF